MVLDVNATLLQELQIIHAENGRSPYVFVNPRIKKPFRFVKTGFKAACKRAGTFWAIPP